MTKTNEMLNAINARIKQLSILGYQVVDISDFSTKRADVSFCHSAMGDGWRYHSVFTRRWDNTASCCIDEMNHESHVEGWNPSTEVERVRKSASRYQGV